MSKTDNALRAAARLAAAKAASRGDETPEPKKQRGGGSAKARRKAARLAAVQALYQIDLTGTNPETVLGEFVKHRIGQEIDGDRYVAADPQLFADILRGAMARREEVDRIVTGSLDPQWPLDRLELLLRAILRAGAFEILAHGGTHARILISEYVDVGRAFFAGREPGMVNGVLDRVARTLRPDEVSGEGRDPAGE
ncbi:transcription antitermination factor NusB [Arenibaculum sp.]|jgi:N utilization substance protein B|uniref:transcription antitermination factor NusB n=1 Tax=Arenibaculum sp. TaxID=2865862 RepID=UPI002E0F6AD4|nr:transcription antitermination factor NusB [Arenibaculum sp.]